MPHISRSTLLISIALMIAVSAAACDSAAEKPAAEPPTPVPTVVLESASSSDDELSGETAGRIREPRDRGAAGATNLADPEVQECLAAQLDMDLSAGEFDLRALRQLDPTETAAAFEACSAEFGRPDGGGGTLGGGGFADSGLNLGCITAELGEDAITLLRNPEGASQAELQQALEACGGVIDLTEGPNVTGSIPIEPGAVPTATAIPVSELTIEQLTCLSGELEPSDLAAAVVATSAGDLSEITGELLAVLQTCGAGS